MAITIGKCTIKITYVRYVRAGAVIMILKYLTYELRATFKSTTNQAL